MDDNTTSRTDAARDALARAEALGTSTRAAGRWVGTAHAGLGVAVAAVALLMAVLPPFGALSLLTLPAVALVVLQARQPVRPATDRYRYAVVGALGFAVLVAAAVLVGEDRHGDWAFWAAVAAASGGPSLALGLVLRRR